MADEIIDSIIKLTLDNKQALAGYEQLKTAYAKVLQDADRLENGRVRHNIDAYRKMADANIQSVTAIRKAEQSAHVERIKNLENELALSKKAAQSRINMLDEEAKKENSLKMARMGRIGAGIASMTGNYRLAGGMYAASNAAQMMGLNVPTGAAAGIGMAAGAAAGVTSLLMYGRELNIELAKMSTLLLPATASTGELSSAMDKAADSASRLSVRFNTDIVDVVKAYKEALSSGIEDRDLERFGRIAGTLSKALGEDFGSSVSILTNFKDTYGGTISDLKEFSDVIFNVVDVGNVKVPQLLHNFGRLTPVAKAAGIGIKDLGGAFAALSRQMTVPQATTGLLNMIRVLQNPSEKEQRAMQEYGVLFGQIAFEGRSLVEIVEDIKVKTGGNGAAIAAMFGDVQASRAIQALTSTLDLLKQMPEEMAKAGTASVAAGRAQNTFWDTLESKVKSVTNAVKIFGSETANAINKAHQFYRDPRRDSSAEEYAFKYLESKNVDELSFGWLKAGLTQQGSKGLIDKTGAYFNKDILSGLRSYRHEGGGWAMDDSTIQKYLSWLDERKGGARDAASSKEKENQAAQEALDAQLKERQDEMSKRSIRLRLAELNERFSPEQKDKYQSLQAGLETYKEKSDVSIYNKWMAARHGVTDKNQLRSINESYAKEQKLREEEIKKREAIITAFEDEVLKQQEYKDIKAEETAIRKQLVHNLKLEVEAQKQAVRDEIEALREYKADLKDKPGRKAGFKYSQTGNLINGKPQKVGMWDPGSAGISYEKERDAVDAKIDMLQKKLYDLGQSVQEVTYQMTNSANSMNSTASAFLAAGNAVATSIANFMTHQNIAISAGSEINVDKTVSNVKKGLEKAKRNGTSKSNYQWKSPVPLITTVTGMARDQNGNLIGPAYNQPFPSNLIATATPY